METKVDKKVAIVQSNYIPWKGYFDLIAAVDEFVLYDDVQFTKNDWRNRNKIKTPNGIAWISIPVGLNIRRRICEVTLPNTVWQKKHWEMLRVNYRRAPFFNEVAKVIEPLYVNSSYSNLSELNRVFIETICGYLKIQTKISNSSDYNLIEGRVERLVDLCVQVGATQYFSGPAARDYLDESRFCERGIDVLWFDYLTYPQYPQLWGDFEHGVSILDLLFNCGPQSNRYMKHLQRN